MRSFVVVGAMLVLAPSTARAEGIVSARYDAPPTRSPATVRPSS